MCRLGTQMCALGTLLRRGLSYCCVGCDREFWRAWRVWHSEEATDDAFTRWPACACEAKDATPLLGLKWIERCTIKDYRGRIIAGRVWVVDADRDLMGDLIGRLIGGLRVRVSQDLMVV